jgi:hypothetical protein
MDKDTKAAFAKLTETVEKAFAAVAVDLDDIKDRLTSVESKIADVNRRLDNDATLRSNVHILLSDLQRMTYDGLRVSKHPPL